MTKYFTAKQDELFHRVAMLLQYCCITCIKNQWIIHIFLKTVGVCHIITYKEVTHCEGYHFANTAMNVYSCGIFTTHVHTGICGDTPSQEPCIIWQFVKYCHTPHLCSTPIMHKMYTTSFIYKQLFSTVHGIICHSKTPVRLVNVTKQSFKIQ